MRSAWSRQNQRGCMRPEEQNYMYKNKHSSISGSGEGGWAWYFNIIIAMMGVVRIV